MRSARRRSMRAKRQRGRRLHKYGDRDVLDYYGGPVSAKATVGSAAGDSTLPPDEVGSPGPRVVLTLGGEPVVVKVRPDPLGVPFGLEDAVYSGQQAVGADQSLAVACSSSDTSTDSPQAGSRRRRFKFSIPGITKRADRAPNKAGGRYSMVGLGRTTTRRSFSWRKFCLSAGLCSGMGSLALLLMHWVGG